MPLKDILCGTCGFQWEEYFQSHRDEESVACPHCEDGGSPEMVPSYPGGYRIKGNNSASTTPKGSGSPKKVSNK